MLSYGRTDKNPDGLSEWEKLEKGESIDPEQLFSGYQSAVDFPSFYFYKNFLDLYPDAKVILTVRDPDKWYQSAAKTIFRPIPGFFLLMARIIGLFSKRARMFPKVLAFTKRVGHQQVFGGKIDDPEHCKAVFTNWNEQVKKELPPKKLLVFEVQQGWEPLCQFLGVPVPNQPFPHSNKGESFHKNARKKVLFSKD